MRKILALLLCLALMPLPAAGAEALILSVESPAEIVRPGKAVAIAFEAPAAGLADILVLDAQGQTVSVVAQGYQAFAGHNELYWNGTWQGAPAPEGSFALTVRLGEETASAPVTVGGYAPYLYEIAVENGQAMPGAPASVSCAVSEAGTLRWGLWVDGTYTPIGTAAVTAGERCTLHFDPAEGGLALADGDYAFAMTLMDATGFDSTEEHVTLHVAGFAEAEVPLEALPEESESTEEPPEALTDEGAPMEEPLDDLPEGSEPAEEPLDELPDEDGLLEGLIEVEEHVNLDTGVSTVTPADGVFTPSYGSPYTEAVREYDYWTTPMDITDEEAIWNMLMQPITVVDNGKDNAQKLQVIIRAEPDEESAGVGVVTCISQSVRVLETRDDGWTLVETYSSSFHDNTVQAWNMLVQGYLPTKYLKTTTPNQEMGIVIDKLTQRMYIFKDGALYDTLLVSTGLANERQPYNETRSGEFLLLLPAVGGFNSDNLVCSMGIRFNDGDLLHEVPHTVNGDGSSNYSSCEPKLGTRASHGCIRVQRKKTPLGTNMTWLWEQIRGNSSKSIKSKPNVKLVIWEDWQGRQIPTPEDSTLLYYNPNGGTMYHNAETCYSAVGKTFTAFTYGELEQGDFAKLERCQYCTPPLRVAEIEAINEVYLPGGDHDPIMTAAREKWLASQAQE